jgi:hypothetical protein
MWLNLRAPAPQQFYQGFTVGGTQISPTSSED